MSWVVPKILDNHGVASSMTKFTELSPPSRHTGEGQYLRTHKSD
ncbi:hypothetical protein [Vibrio breoganii]|nr:hypothetical protein [Vibrio breoganii]